MFRIGVVDKLFTNGLSIHFLIYRFFGRNTDLTSSGRFSSDVFLKNDFWVFGAKGGLKYTFNLILVGNIFDVLCSVFMESFSVKSDNLGHWVSHQ